MQIEKHFHIQKNLSFEMYCPGVPSLGKQFEIIKCRTFFEIFCNASDDLDKFNIRKKYKYTYFFHHFVL